MINEYKPCPFCDSAEVTMWYKYGYIYCQCDCCGAKTEGVKAEYSENKEDFWIINETQAERARAKWNLRKEKDENAEILLLKQKINALNNKIEELQKTVSRKEFEWLCKTVNAINNKLDKKDI
jgi:uncharacterized Zn finger protein (UPF0148 family)